MSNEYDIIKACADGNIEYVKTYIANALNLNTVIANETPLNVAVEHQQKEMVLFLLKNGADVNFTPHGGWSALHQAVDITIDGTLQTAGDFGEPPTDVIQLLIDNGANINITVDGQTPLDIAKYYGQHGCRVAQKIIKFLEAFVSVANP
jgi:ankyrin repeat protein